MKLVYTAVVGIDVWASLLPEERQASFSPSAACGVSTHALVKTRQDGSTASPRASAKLERLRESWQETITLVDNSSPKSKPGTVLCRSQQWSTISLPACAKISVLAAEGSPINKTREPNQHRNRFNDIRSHLSGDDFVFGRRVRSPRVSNAFLGEHVYSLHETER